MGVANVALKQVADKREIAYCVIDVMPPDLKLEALLSEFFEIKFCKTPNQLNKPEMESWLKENVTALPKAIFYYGDEDTVPSMLIHCLRSQNKFVPVIIFDKGQSCSIKRLIDNGINDVIPLNAPSEDVMNRIQLRIKECYEIESLQKMIESLKLKETKNEIALKQREEFLGICAHDLRTPLGIIQTSISMILGSKEGKLLDSHHDLLSRSKRQASHALALVNDLLDVMSYEQGLKPLYKILDLNEILLQFYNDYKIKTDEKGIAFKYQNPLKGWRILADPERVTQLLQNLFTNAVKFTDAGKNIYLTVDSFLGRRKVDPSYPMVLISLADEGKGIPREEAQKIFDRFSQLKDYSRTEGRGLGLSVVKQISNSHDGNVWVESEVEKGSTFHVLFPHAISRLTIEPSSRSKKLILIAEPSLQKRALYFSQLSDWGYELVYSKDGADCIAQAFHFLPDAILLTEDLSKIKATDIGTIIKSDKLTQDVKVALAVESGKMEPLKGFDTMLYLPCDRVSIESIFKVPQEKGLKVKKI